MNTLNTKQLQTLADAHAIKTIAVCGVEGGFTITINGKLIEKQRGNARLFRKLQAVAIYLKNNGVNVFTVNVLDWIPNQNHAGSLKTQTSQG
jgi:hypothetical protein